MDLLERFNGLKALVIGDVMIDVYSKGVVERMSPEAPVPIVDVKERFARLGGAANVALNLKALGAMPILCSVIGNDENHKLLINLMFEAGLDTSHFAISETRKTTVKHRIFNGEKQVLRMDEEDTSDLTDEEYQRLWDVIGETLDKDHFDVIILQDYNKGVLSKKMIQAIIAEAKKRNIRCRRSQKEKLLRLSKCDALQAQCQRAS